jgi:hypothetical protein
MNIDDIKQMIQKDLHIKDTELDIESLRIPQLHNKYLNLLYDEKFKLQALRVKRKILVREKWEYYTGKMDEESLKQRGWEPFNLKILKQDVNLYIDSDSDLISIDSKLFLQQERVDFLQESIKAINNIQWHIRDAIAWRKFINGVN